MAGLTDYSSRSFLNHLVGKTAIYTLPTNVYVALFTTVGVDAGTGFTEAAFPGYARVLTSGASWNAAAGSSPSSITNAATITFPTSTGTGSAIVGFGLYDAATAGNLLAWDYLGNFSWTPFSCSLASPGVLTVPAHGFSNADSVVVDNEFGGTLPATAGSWAGLLTVAGVATDTFTAGVNTTSTGSGMVRKVVTQAVVNNLQLSFAAASLSIFGA